MLDFSNFTFLIPFMGDGGDRNRNLRIVLQYIETHFSSNVIIVEQGGHAPDIPFQLVNSNLEKIAIDNRTGNKIHKTRLYNVGLSRIKTPYVICYDADVLLPVKQLQNAASHMSSGKVDYCYPFSQGYVEILKDPSRFRENLLSTYNFVEYSKNIMVYAKNLDRQEKLRRPAPSLPSNNPGAMRLRRKNRPNVAPEIVLPNRLRHGQHFFPVSKSQTKEESSLPQASNAPVARGSNLPSPAFKGGHHEARIFRGNPPGGCIFITRKAYIEMGMENEDFIGYAPEDAERKHRLEKLGYHTAIVGGYVYHLEHDVKYKRNSPKEFVDMFERIKTFNRQELIDFYKRKGYPEKYGVSP